jgi:hypothetical protein
VIGRVIDGPEDPHVDEVRPERAHVPANVFDAIFAPRLAASACS